MWFDNTALLFEEKSEQKNNRPDYGPDYLVFSEYPHRLSMRFPASSIGSAFDGTGKAGFDSSSLILMYYLLAGSLIYNTGRFLNKSGFLSFIFFRFDRLKRRFDHRLGATISALGFGGSFDPLHGGLVCSQVTLLFQFSGPKYNQLRNIVNRKKELS